MDRVRRCIRVMRLVMRLVNGVRRMRMNRMRWVWRVLRVTSCRRPIERLEVGDVRRQHFALPFIMELS